MKIGRSRFKKDFLRKDLAKVDAAPMTDVIFLLLIFFMISSSFVILPSVKIKLPETVINEASKDKKLVVTIDSKKNIFVNDRKVKKSKLLSILPSYIQETKDLSVMIKADKRVPHGLVVQIMDISKQAGVKKISIATEPKRRN